MAGWGIGLGSFVNGFQGGYGLRQRMDSDKITNEMNTIKLDSMKRDQQRQGELDTLGKQSGADFNNAVTSGQADADHPDEWFSKNYAPKMESFFLAHNDLENAAKWNAWASDANTKKQVKAMGQLIGQYHDGAATGDFSGLKTSFGKFYNSLPKDTRSGSEFQDLTVSKDANGGVTGVTATFKGADGKPITHTWNDMPSFQQSLESWANPTVLYQQTMKDGEAAKKFKSDVAEYAAKKGIDLRYAAATGATGIKGKTPQERYASAQETLAKGSMDGKPPTDAAVRAYLKQQDDYAASQSQAAPGLAVGPIAGSVPAEGEGAPATPAIPKVIVNQKTGQVVPGGAPAQAAAPIPMPTSPASITAPAPTGNAPAQAPAPQPTVGPSTRGTTSNSMGRMYREQNPLNADEQQAMAENARAPGIGAPTPTQQTEGNPRSALAVGLAPTPSKPPLYVGTQQAPAGMLRQGNIDLNRRPVVKNEDGSISTVRSITITLPDGKAVLLPTVVGGRVVSNEEAIKHFKKTGENLGIFQDEPSADTYANALHEQQAAAYLPKGS